MAYTQIGRIRPRNRGVHSTTTSYQVMDLVSNAAGDIAYMAIKNVPTGMALTNTTYWIKFLDVSALIGPTGPVGPQGERGSTWHRGTSVTGTTTVDWESGMTEELDVRIGDYYLNTDTFNIYIWVEQYDMTTGQTTNTWLWLGSIVGAQGPRGNNGNSTSWYTGTGITGTSTTPTIFSSSGVTSAVAGDMYLNKSTGNVYICTSGGSRYAALWKYECNIKGAKGTNGTTPVRGVDYWTEADKAEVVSLTLAALPKYTGEVEDA